MKKPKKIKKHLKGFLLVSFTGTNVFRVYKKNKEFIDYKIRHNDLEIQIEDNDAYIYENKKGEMIIDYSPKTLGVW